MTDTTDDTASAKKQRRRSKGRVDLSDRTTKERARHLASIGCTDSQIASALGISVTSLRKRCARALKRGRVAGEVALLEAQHAMAVEPADETSKFSLMSKSNALQRSLRARLGWRDQAGASVNVTNLNKNEQHGPVLISPGVWPEDLWNRRAREHQDLVLERATAAMRLVSSRDEPPQPKTAEEGGAPVAALSERRTQANDPNLEPVPGTSRFRLKSTTPR